jgi:hypothetical protein
LRTIAGGQAILTLVSTHYDPLNEGELTASSNRGGDQQPGENAANAQLHFEGLDGHNLMALGKNNQEFGCLRSWLIELICKS